MSSMPELISQEQDTEVNSQNLLVESESSRSTVLAVQDFRMRVEHLEAMQTRILQHLRIPTSSIFDRLSGMPDSSHAYGAGVEIQNSECQRVT